MTAEAEAEALAVGAPAAGPHPDDMVRPHTDDMMMMDETHSDADADADADAEHEVDDLAEAKPKKKRRVVKLSDKKYECPHPTCGKSYSRAEHLYRHQLNRTSTPCAADASRLRVLY